MNLWNSPSQKTVEAQSLSSFEAEVDIVVYIKGFKGFGARARK